MKMIYEETKTRQNKLKTSYLKMIYEEKYIYFVGMGLTVSLITICIHPRHTLLRRYTGSRPM